MDYKTGINLYKVFKKCLEEDKDKARLKRLSSRLDLYNNSLTAPQKHDFAAILVEKGLIPADSPLGRAIKVFEASVVKFNE